IGDTSSDPDTADVLTYAWDFGDGTTATTANPAHTFTTVGTYDVTLTVTDDGTPALNSTDTIAIIVTDANQAPTAIATSDITSGEASLNVQFIGDTSSDPDTADVLTYAWDFGDGTTATTANPAHTFTTVGTYDVTLTVTDDGTPALSSSEVTLTITVTDANQAPTAIATSNVSSGILDLDVEFTGSNSSDPDAGDTLTYAWDFGDGTTATTANPSHTFTTAGTYMVTLTVSDDGTPILNDTDTITITVGKPNISAFVDAGEDILVGPFDYQFRLEGNFSGLTTISSILWEEISTGSSTILSPNSFNTNVTITSGGTYIYKLTVIDNLGGVGSDIIEVTVVQCPDSCSTGESKCYDPVTKICSCINNSGPVTVLCEAEGN
ncbi:PKD domain-containing protein, partial [Cellulophaga baltica]|uniref:PKD domain-containing protein n=1 Tax=Cellulophaga baltica TaxID=76594 RepID=UPI002148E8C7